MPATYASEGSSSSASRHDGLEASKPQATSWWRRLLLTQRPHETPSWLKHFNKHDLKTLFRCVVAVWVAMLLIFIHPSLQNFGQATFFAALVLYASPPSSVLALYVLASFSLLLGMCLAWAWGLLVMKAAQSARPGRELQTQLQALQREAAARVGGASASKAAVMLEAQKLVHDGFLLDTRVTVVFFTLGCLFIYVLARLRCANQKLTLTQIFGTITMDLFIVYGPTLPSYNPSLAAILVKPAAAGTAIGLACCVLFFPQSTSYVVLDKLEKLVLMLEMPLVWTREHLARQPPEMDSLTSAKRHTIGLYKSVEPLLAFLPLDFARCRWNSDDVKALQGKVRKLMMASLSLLDLHIAKVTVDQKRRRSQVLREAETAAAAVKSSEKNAGAEIGRRQMRETAILMDAFHGPEQGAVLAQAASALHDTTLEAIETCRESMTLVARCIRTVNSRRWFRVPPQSEFEQLASRLDEQLGALRLAKTTCTNRTTAAILDVHKDIFEEGGQLKETDDTGSPALLAIVNSMVVEERILTVVEATEELLEETLLLTRTRQKHRIWLPKRLQYAVSWVLDTRATVPMCNSSGTDTNTANPGTPMDMDAAVFQSQVEEAQKRLRIIRGYGNVNLRRRNPVGRAIISTAHWLTNSAGMYALRMVIVTIGTAIPAVVGHSAGFFYREKGLWGVITAQTCILVYMADFTLSIVARLLGTIFGGVLGLIAWYIGSGSGPGNPYGLAAITPVMITMIVYLRVFLPMTFTIATVLSGATFSLIIGYSYDEHHITQYGLPGVGATAFWKRVVAVLLGFVAAFVVQVIPKPPSSTRHVCYALANAVRALSDHYAFLLSHWGRAEQNLAIANVGEKLSLDLAELLLSLHGSINILKLELTSSPFNPEVLRKAKDQCHVMNQALKRLLELVTTLPRDFQLRLVDAVGILDDHIIGDVMAVLALIEQSLRTGTPLPERTPAPLVRVFFQEWRARTPSILLTRDLVRDENYRRYCVGVTAYLQFLSTIDDLLLVLKGTLGECHVIQREEPV